MKKKLQKPASYDLRQKAEELLDKKRSSDYTPDSDADIRRFIHELEVHQIELELQNEELREARGAAWEAVQKYSELYDFAPFGYFTLSREGQILELNLHGARLLAEEKKFLKNKWFNYFVSEDSITVFDQFIYSLYEDRIKKSCEIKLNRYAKSPIDVHLNGIFIENTESCLINIIDITDKKQTEGIMIENQRLTAMGEMASAIAHDFNNSLQLISGNLQLAMLHPELPDAVNHHLNNIILSVNDTTDRVKALQRFGEKKKDQGNHEPTDLNALIAEVINQSRPFWKDEAERKGIHVTLQTKIGEIPEVPADKAEMRMVIYNMIKNSVEAMPKGGVITFETGKRMQNLYLSIADNGIGMNEETRTRIFQPFYSTKGFGIGRGLGMSGVYTIIREHGWNIEVKSTIPGKGTVIEISIPMPLKTKTEVKEVTKEQKPGLDADLKGGIKILWVDDESLINNLVFEMMKILGYKIDVANSAKDALALLDQNEYQLVITDLGMPGMDGWQLADVIKERFGSRIKVAVSSGWGTQVTESDKLKHGVSYKMDKPFSISQLKKLVQEVEDNI